MKLYFDVNRCKLKKSKVGYYKSLPQESYVVISDNFIIKTKFGNFIVKINKYNKGIEIVSMSTRMSVLPNVANSITIKGEEDV